MSASVRYFYSIRLYFHLACVSIGTRKENKMREYAGNLYGCLLPIPSGIDELRFSKIDAMRCEALGWLIIVLIDFIQIRRNWYEVRFVGDATHSHRSSVCRHRTPRFSMCFSFYFCVDVSFVSTIFSQITKKTNTHAIHFYANSAFFQQVRQISARCQLKNTRTKINHCNHENEWIKMMVRHLCADNVAWMTRNDWKAT